MKMLSSPQLEKVISFVDNNARQLDKVLLQFLLGKASMQDVAKELQMYQNSDGGFGNGLEPDFRTPTSSNMATSFAFQYLDVMNGTALPDFMLKALDFY